MNKFIVTLLALNSVAAFANSDKWQESIPQWKYVADATYIDNSRIYRKGQFAYVYIKSDGVAPIKGIVNRRLFDCLKKEVYIRPTTGTVYWNDGTTETFNYTIDHRDAVSISKLDADSPLQDVYREVCKK